MSTKNSKFYLRSWNTRKNIDDQKYIFKICIIKYHYSNHLYSIYLFLSHLYFYYLFNITNNLFLINFFLFSIVILFNLFSCIVIIYTSIFLYIYSKENYVLYVRHVEESKKTCTISLILNNY